MHERETRMWILTPNKFLTPKQVAQLRTYLKGKAAPGGARHRTRWMVIDLLLSTGLRCMEAVALDIESIYIDDGQSSIHVVNGKGHKSAVIQIGKELKEHMIEYLDGRETGPFLLSERGSRYSRGGLQSLVKRAFKDACLPSHFSIHSCRHTFATLLLRVTKNLRHVQKQLRHSSPTTTAVYADVIDEDLKAGMESLYD